MYIPKAFKEEDLNNLQELMARYPLATMVTIGPDGMEANPVPLLHNPAPREGAPNGVLRGYLARACGGDNAQAVAGLMARSLNHPFR